MFLVSLGVVSFAFIIGYRLGEIHTLKHRLREIKEECDEVYLNISIEEKAMTQFRLGDKVKINLKGSGLDNEEGTIYSLDDWSSDNIHGLGIQLSSGYTVVEPEFVTIIGER